MSRPGSPWTVRNIGRSIQFGGAYIVYDDTSSEPTGTPIDSPPYTQYSSKIYRYKYNEEGSSDNPNYVGRYYWVSRGKRVVSWNPQYSALFYAGRYLEGDWLPPNYGIRSCCITNSTHTAGLAIPQSSMYLTILLYSGYLNTYKIAIIGVNPDPSHSGKLVFNGAVYSNSVASLSTYYYLSSSAIPYWDELSENIFPIVSNSTVNQIVWVKFNVSSSIVLSITEILNEGTISNALFQAHEVTTSDYEVISGISTETNSATDDLSSLSPPQGRRLVNASAISGNLFYLWYRIDEIQATGSSSAHSVLEKTIYTPGYFDIEADASNSEEVTGLYSIFMGKIALSDTQDIPEWVLIAEHVEEVDRVSYNSTAHVHSENQGYNGNVHSYYEISKSTSYTSTKSYLHLSFHRADYIAGKLLVLLGSSVTQVSLEYSASQYLSPTPSVIPPLEGTKHTTVTDSGELIIVDPTTGAIVRTSLPNVASSYSNESALSAGPIAGSNTDTTINRGYFSNREDNHTTLNDSAREYLASNGVSVSFYGFIDDHRITHVDLRPPYECIQFENASVSSHSGISLASSKAGAALVTSPAP